MSGLSSTLNYYRAAGSIPRSVSDKNLPFYISAGGVTVSGQDPDVWWVQSSLIPMSTTIYRLWNLQMVASTNIIDANVPIQVTVDVGFPIVFKEGLPLTGSFSVSANQVLYNAYKFWTVESQGTNVVFSFIPSSLSLTNGYIQFFLNFNLCSTVR